MGCAENYNGNYWPNWKRVSPIKRIRRPTAFKERSENTALGNRAAGRRRNSPQVHPEIGVFVGPGDTPPQQFGPQKIGLIKHTQYFPHHKENPYNIKKNDLSDGYLSLSEETCPQFTKVSVGKGGRGVPGVELSLEWEFPGINKISYVISPCYAMGFWWSMLH